MPEDFYEPEITDVDSLKSLLGGFKSRLRDQFSALAALNGEDGSVIPGNFMLLGPQVHRPKSQRQFKMHPLLSRK